MAWTMLLLFLATLALAGRKPSRFLLPSDSAL
jgi:hypothetical protein